MAGGGCSLNPPLLLVSGFTLRGGTHIFGWTGMCRSNGSLFYKKSLNMGPILNQKLLKHGSTFLTEPKLWRKPENRKFFKIWAYFSRKILKNEYLFLAKITLKRWVGVLRLKRHTPVQTKSEYPPGFMLHILATVSQTKIQIWQKFHKITGAQKLFNQLLACVYSF